jgi:hypothetical protein
MHEQTENLFINEYRALPSSIFGEYKNYNMMWGPEYFIYLFNELKNDEIEKLIDGLMIIRALS